MTVPDSSPAGATRTAGPAGPMIRRMTRAEVDDALAWAAEDGWTPGLHDADAVFVTDPGGLLIAETADGPAGCIAATAYDDHFGFVGLFHVRPDHRADPAVADALWRAALDRLGTRTIGVDRPASDLESVHAYGFQPAETLVRHTGIGGGEAPRQAVDLRVFTFDRLVAFDAGVFGAARPSFLKVWTETAHSRDVGVIGTQGVIAGYGVVRACRGGHHIGPLFADSHDHADTLIRALLAAVPGEPVVIDIPVANRQATQLADQHGLRPGLEITRLYKGTPPPADLGRTYAITSHELG